MPIAAVPGYLQGQNFTQASPGMRFGLYLQLWGINRRTSQRLWGKKDTDYKVSGPEHKEREVEIENGTTALKAAAALNRNDKDTLNALTLRQQHLAQTVAPCQLLALDAMATAPFTTGLGNEHPLENGFAFLNPYGLPYLPGSSIKGVMRQAARELASGDWGEHPDWPQQKIHQLLQQNGAAPIDLSTIDVLFGLESIDGSSTHVRGVLTFWDSVPHIQADHLQVEIMTPHQGHYYQQGNDHKTGASTSPHDSGQPVPIHFLTVPPGSRFAFHVQCDLPRLQKLAPDLAKNERWKQLLTTAFEHAFEWLGFGAKTAVGYGAMESEAQRQRLETQIQAEAQLRKEQAQAEAQLRKEQAQAEAQLRQQKNAMAWHGAQLKFNRSNGTLTANKDGQTATALAPRGEELLKTLPADIQNKIRTSQFVRMTAYVAEGNVMSLETA